MARLDKEKFLEDYIATLNGTGIDLSGEEMVEAMASFRRAYRSGAESPRMTAMNALAWAAVHVSSLANELQDLGVLWLAVTFHTVAGELAKEELAEIRAGRGQGNGQEVP